MAVSTTTFAQRMRRSNRKNHVDRSWSRVLPVRERLVRFAQVELQDGSAIDTNASTFMVILALVAGAVKRNCARWIDLPSGRRSLRERAGRASSSGGSDREQSLRW
jgi:hypothetical protein